MVIVFSQYLKHVKCPLPTYRKEHGWSIKKLDIFTLLPVDGSNSKIFQNINTFYRNHITGSTEYRTSMDIVRYFDCKRSPTIRIACQDGQQDKHSFRSALVQVSLSMYRNQLYCKIAIKLT